MPPFSNVGVRNGRGIVDGRSTEHGRGHLVSKLFCGHRPAGLLAQKCHFAPGANFVFSLDSDRGVSSENLGVVWLLTL